MKIKAYVFVGVLFIAMFVGLSLLGQSLGYWHLPGQATEEEHKEESGEQIETPASGELIELHGYMNLKEYLTKNGISLECVASKLGVSVEELNVEAKEISHGKGFEMEEIFGMAKECRESGKVNEIKTDSSVASKPLAEPVEKADEKSEESTEKPIGYDRDDDKPIKIDEMKGLIKPGEEPPPIDDLNPVPFLKGSDNLKEFCIANSISLECLAKKLGIPESELDKIAKDVAAKLPSGHVEEIRTLLPGCLDFTR